MTASLALAPSSTGLRRAPGSAPDQRAAEMAQAACAAAAFSSAHPGAALSSPGGRDDAGLPPLRGSASDIAAAMVIRARALRRLRLDLAERIREEASARWWIDHRHQVCG